MTIAADPVHATRITTAWNNVHNAIKDARADGLTVAMKYTVRVRDDGVLDESKLCCSIVRVLK